MPGLLARQYKRKQVGALMLLMLEDNAERVQRFTETLHDIDSGLALLVWRDAKAMIREVGPHASCRGR
jgi:hypothetical protein